MKELEGTIGYTLVGVCRAHRNRAAEALARVGLYVGQEWILLRLREQNGMTQSELAEACAVEGPTMSKGLQRMERAKLVARRTDTIDARVSRVYLTDQGRNVCEAVDAIWSDLEECTLTGLAADERILLGRLLHQVRQNLA